MKREEKQLLFKDLSARLPYHVRVKVWLEHGLTEEGHLDLQHNYGDVLRDAFYYKKIKKIKPYLRPMSSMTEKERFELGKAIQKDIINLSGGIEEDGLYNLLLCTVKQSTNLLDWLNIHHFDYRGFIEKGLALEAPEKMYND